MKYFRYIVILLFLLASIAIGVFSCKQHQNGIIIGLVVDTGTINRYKQDSIFLRERASQAFDYAVKEQRRADSLQSIIYQRERGYRHISDFYNPKKRIKH